MALAGQGSAPWPNAVAATLTHPVGLASTLHPSTSCPEERALPLLPGGPEFKAAEAQASAALSSLLHQLCLQPTPPVRTAVALNEMDAALGLPPDVLHQVGSAPQEEAQAWAR